MILVTILIQVYKGVVNVGDISDKNYVELTNLLPNISTNTTDWQKRSFCYSDLLSVVSDVSHQTEESDKTSNITKSLTNPDFASLVMGMVAIPISPAP